MIRNKFKKQSQLPQNPISVTQAIVKEVYMDIHGHGPSQVPTPGPESGPGQPISHKKSPAQSVFDSAGVLQHLVSMSPTEQRKIIAKSSKSGRAAVEMVSAQETRKINQFVEQIISKARDFAGEIYEGNVTDLQSLLSQDRWRALEDKTQDIADRMFRRHRRQDTLSYTIHELISNAISNYKEKHREYEDDQKIIAFIEDLIAFEKETGIHVLNETIIFRAMDKMIKGGDLSLIEAHFLVENLERLTKIIQRGDLKKIEDKFVDVWVNHALGNLIRRVRREEEDERPYADRLKDVAIDMAQKYPSYVVAEYLIEKGDFAQAAEIINGITENETKNDLLGSIISKYFQQGNLAKAQEYFDKMVLIQLRNWSEPNFNNALRALGEQFKSQKDEIRLMKLVYLLGGVSPQYRGELLISLKSILMEKGLFKEIELCARSIANIVAACKRYYSPDYFPGFASEEQVCQFYENHIKQTAAELAARGQIEVARDVAKYITVDSIKRAAIEAIETLQKKSKPSPDSAAGAG